MSRRCTRVSKRFSAPIDVSSGGTCVGGRAWLAAAGRLCASAARARRAWVAGEGRREPAPVLGSQRQAVQGISDGDRADPLQIGGAALSDALEQLQRGGKRRLRLFRTW